MKVAENMEEIEFNKKNFHTCLCPNCPVEAESNCAQIKLNPIKGSKDIIMPIPKVCQDYTARQEKLHVLTLTLIKHVNAPIVIFGKNII